MTPDGPGPIFLVGAPRSGLDLLLASLANASGVRRLADAPLHEALERDAHALRDVVAEAAEGGVVLAGGADLTAHVGVLASALDDARFVFVARDPAHAVADLVAADGVGSPAEAVKRWRESTETALGQLESLDGERWRAVDIARLLQDPRGELRRLCDALGIRYDQALLGPLEDAARRLRAAASAVPPHVEAVLPAAADAAARAARAVGETDAPAADAPQGNPFRSVFTGSFADRLAVLRSSLLISTYQTGKLICARVRDGDLNTHFRDFQKPMGIAVRPGRFALGTRTEVWDMRDMPEVAPKLDPPGTHDACYLPRNRHVTGDVAVHELAFAGDELWLVATSFSCLATLDADHSIVPRWKPPFISAIAPGDRCHLNGLAVVDGRPRYVTALGQTDEPGGWRPGKATDGVIVDVESSELVATGLSMPHSPRWHDGRLWVLESGRGELCLVDLDTGRSETVAELPGFTRGLAFAGHVAFVGLSQIRESSTFGDLPLVERLDERLCGVWAVDLVRGAVEGFLRFDDLVQEVFDVALLPGKRYPEVAEPASSAVATSFVLP